MNFNPRGQSISVIFAVPLFLAVVTALGLLSALLGDGAWDVLSWVLLVVPLETAVFCVLISIFGARVSSDEA